MKLYLSNLDLSKITIDKIKEYCIISDNMKEIYTDEGVYVSKNGQGYKKYSFIDNDIKFIKNYLENHDLIIDESFVYKSKETVSRIPVNHNVIHVTKNEYKMSPKSPVTLAVERCDDKITSVYFMLTNFHGKYSLPDIDNQFTKETIHSFYALIF
uniref:Uncharacterized protein n=1 Tax=viral metagenome TaxID=1070528 RepID=A0A6C0LJT2_9ZZZZ|tara:strand:+ start:604 stop:1068 length:465 start_codon:yes stop_codon:yes gene_type:complete